MDGRLVMVFLGLTFLVFQACNGKKDHTDAGSDADAGGDQGDHQDLDHFMLVIEPEASACGVFEQFRSWRQELALLGRLHFHDDELALPTGVDTFEADLIDRVEFGPGRIELIPTTTGTFTHVFEHQGDLLNGCHRYTYRQSFALENEPYEIEMHLSYCLNGGVASRQLIRINDDFSTEVDGLTAYLGDGSDVFSQQQFFGPCWYRDLELYQVVAEVEQGDRVMLDKRLELSIAGTGSANITRAEVNVDGVTREIEDYFCLVYAADHHNWNEQFVILLDPPVGNVHGLLLEKHDYWQDPVELIYLDSEIEEFARKPLISFTETSR